MDDSQPTTETHNRGCTTPATMPTAVWWLQGITLAWMLIETVVSLYSAQQARSVALLAFGSDSVVELLSASVALLSFIPTVSLDKERAERWAGILLFALAGVVVLSDSTGNKLSRNWHCGSRSLRHATACLGQAKGSEGYQ